MSLEEVKKDVRAEQLSIKKMAKFLHKISLSGPCVLVVKAGTELAKIDTINQIAKAVEKMNQQAIVVVADELSDIQRYSEAQMAQKGWYRIETIKKLLDKEKK